MSLSLRQKLVLRVVLAVACVVVLSGVVLDLFVSGSLRSGLDKRLLDWATDLATEVWLDADGVATELAEFDHGPVAYASDPEFLQVTGEGGTVHFLSRARAGRPLPVVPVSAGEAAFATIRLENGAVYRCVHYGLRPPVGEPMERGQEDAGPAGPILILTIARGTASLQHDLVRLRIILVTVVLTTVLALLIAVLALIRATLTPVETLAAGIARLDPEAARSGLSFGGIPADFQPIVTRLDDLLARMRQALDRERTFTADFSHEMRTPIAGLRSSLEVGLSQERQPHEYRELLQECLGMSLDLQNLTETMLTLRRLESGTAALQKSDCRLQELVGQVVAALAEPARERQVTWDVQVGPDLVLATDPPLLELAVRNLLDNAVSHGRRGSRVTIRGARTAAGACLAVENPGGPATQQEADALRARFRRGDASRNAEEGHTGLGLALVEAIGQVLGYELSVKVEAPDLYVARLLFSSGGV